MIDAAVIGCGRMGAFTSASVRKFAPECWFPLAHAEAIEAAQGIQLVALCDANAESLSRAATQYNVGNTYADHASMLTEVVPGLVGIATRTIGRTQIITECHAAGTRAFHIEKPICNSMMELAELEALFDRDDTFVTLGAVRRHFAIYREAVATAHDGDFGALLEARVDMGRGALYWTHPHSVDLVLLAAVGRQVEAVQARLGDIERDGHIIRNDPQVLAASIWFDDGFVGHIGRAPGVDFRLSCENARISVLNDGHSLWLATIDAETPYPEPVRQRFVAGTEPHGTLGPISQLVGCLSGDSAAQRANSRLKADIVLGQRVLFAMVQSQLEGGRPVTLDSIDPKLVIEGRSGQFYA